MQQETREILWNIGTPTKAAMYLMFVAALASFGYGLWRRARVWRRGAKAAPAAASGNGAATDPAPQFDWPGAAGRLVRHVLVQQRIGRIPVAWLSHISIFYGFIVLFIGTVIVAVQEYNVLAPLGVGYFFQGAFYRVVSVALDLFGLAFVAALFVAMARRVGLTKVRPSSKPIDAAILWLFLLIGVTGFVVEALRLVGTGFPEFERVDSFVAWGLARGLAAAGLSAEGAPLWHWLAWVVHMAAVMGFIAIIPYTKLLHFLVAPVNIAITPEKHSGRLEPVSLEQVEETGRFGLAKVEEFPWQRLLSYDACTHCRRCESACPAFNTHKPLSPMRVILDVAAAGERTESLHGDVISAETLWSCTTCGACVHNCPVLIDQMGTIVEMRRHLVGEGQVLGSTQQALRSIGSAGNPWGVPAEDRTAWAAGLDVPTVDDTPQPDVLLWVGCAGSFDRRNQRVTQAVVKVLRAAGVNFAILGKKERCTGDPARRLGDEFTFMDQAQSNVETLNRVKFNKVVTACAHCFNTLKNEYPDYGGNYQVQHHSQFIGELLDAGRLTLKPEDAGAAPVALHDPCYLSRHNQLPQAPRRVLAGTSSLPIVEPEHHGASTFCCGAGGGRMWMEEEIDKRVNLARWQQLKQTGAKTVATACPFCTIMLDDASKADEAAGIEVKDLAEIVAERLA